jgi:hypothetical protein
VTPLQRQVAAVQRWLVAIYRLDLDLEAERFVVEPERARRLLPPGSPRSGLLVLEQAGELQLGLYLDPQDARDPATVIEETSHLLCLVWHAVRDWPVSRLHLELQAEVDRYAVARAAGGDPLGHFRDFGWADWMDAAERRRYQTAHRVAHRYCRRLEARFPVRADTPAWLGELRRFYRAAPNEKLRAA